MKTLKFFLKTFFLLAILTTPLACGSDDNAGGTPPVVDVEATYTVSAAKEVSDYTTGESLATVSDADGAITEASLGSSSSLPTGIALNGTTGELTVSDASTLESGSYSLEITTEDVNGGTTDHTVSITINADADTAAAYTVADAKAVQDYTMGESIATVSDADGDIVGAVLDNGSELPAGTALNADTGEITVADATLLVPGSYEINITTEDAQGGTTSNTITIVFDENPDVAAVYTVNDAKAVEDYAANESIATVSDGNGDIVSAVLDSGSTLPAGTALNAVTGEITVADPMLLVPGTYDLDITTEDENGGTTMHMVTLVFNENPVIVNINSGGGELVFTDITFAADQFFVGTSMPFSPDPLPAIDNTDNDELYTTERFGTDFGYELELENGTYKVTLHFVELYWGAPGGLGSTGGVGDRVFDVSLEGVVVMDDYDIFADVGALFATQKEFEVTLADGKLNIDFMSSADNAKLAALEVEKIN